MTRRWQSTADLIGSESIEPAHLAPIETREDIVERLNLNFAVLSHAGKTRIMRISPDGEFELESVQDFHNWHLNDVIWTKAPNGADVAIQASKTWLQSPNRRQYRGLVFRPGATDAGEIYNLWRGWGVEPNPDGSCALILKHIFEVISAGNQAWFEYNIKYDAHMVQYPDDKPGVARVCRGGRGAGKDTYGELLVKICGSRHCAIIGDGQRLTARFNSLFESAIFVHIEEAFFSGDPRARGTLQHIVTSRDITIERKGFEPFSNPSYLRVFMTTNEDWAIPAGPDERRYAVFDVSDCYKQDHAYFAALRAEIAGGGAGAYLHYLQNLDLTGFNVRDVPQTEALRDQKRESLDPIARWWEGELDDCTWWSSEGATERARIPKAALYGAYVRHTQALRFGGNPKTREIFAKAMKKMCPSIDEERGNRSSDRARVLILPNQRQCRREFERHIGVVRTRTKAELLA